MSAEEKRVFSLECQSFICDLVEKSSNGENENNNSSNKNALLPTGSSSHAVSLRIPPSVESCTQSKENSCRPSHPNGFQTTPSSKSQSQSKSIEVQRSQNKHHNGLSNTPRSSAASSKTLSAASASCPINGGGKLVPGALNLNAPTNSHVFSPRGNTTRPLSISLASTSPCQIDNRNKLNSSGSRTVYERNKLNNNFSRSSDNNSSTRIQPKNMLKAAGLKLDEKCKQLKSKNRDLIDLDKNDGDKNEDSFSDSSNISYHEEESDSDNENELISATNQKTSEISQTHTTPNHHKESADQAYARLYGASKSFSPKTTTDHLTKSSKKVPKNKKRKKMSKNSKDLISLFKSEVEIVVSDDDNDDVGSAKITAKGPEQFSSWLSKDEKDCTPSRSNNSNKEKSVSVSAQSLKSKQMKASTPTCLTPSRVNTIKSSSTTSTSPSSSLSPSDRTKKFSFVPVRRDISKGGITIPTLSRQSLSNNATPLKQRKAR